MSAVEEDREPTRGWWRGRRRLAAAGALGLAALAVIVAVASGAGDDEQRDDSASRSTATTRIERKDLVESEEVDGTLGYADSRTVINRMSGTVTWLPREGSVVKPGERIYAVEGKSVYLLDGRYPAYRTLEAGVEGQDVAQLEHNLRALGFDDDKDMDVDGEWDSATTAAVQRWQRSEGLDDDGSIEVGRVVFQPGARRISERLVDSGGSADAGGGGGSGSGGDGANIGASADGAGARTILASLPIAAASQEVEPTPTPTPSPTATPTPTPRPSPTTTPTPTPTPTPQRTPSPAPQATPTPTPTPTAPSTGGGGAPSGGMSGGGGGSFGGGAPSTGSTTAVQDGAASGGDEQSVASEILTTTSRRRVVMVDLATTRVRLAKRGAEVEVEMPDGSDVDGTITRVGRVATTEDQSDGSESDPTIQLTIRLAKTKGFVIDQAPVDVQLEQRRAEDVLTVPVTALLAQTGGNFGVEVVERDGRRRVVPVEPGMYTDGDVEIEGEGLEEGMTVTDARV